ncbi:o-methyltransferas-like protein [Lindgomyces ingoldianus]|uniref:O-methyltransferas-like protein n=1 Tax=Lindgomyces ingoldianus TaxID=673940 RepID=A0ACB6QQ59_9PLEO|nr:o-methyltransferas-like protein [Lindgomyces ingoldianus]KAF2468992.1 o-methyltransferas-like protein [Lindgomyces ingoldianus]
METLIEKVRQEAAQVDEAGRKKLLNQLRDLQYEVEKPEDTMQRIIHLHLVLATIRMALDLDIFSLLTSVAHPLTLAQLCESTKTDDILLGRVLRLLSSLGYIKETLANTFAATPLCHTLSVPEIRAGVYRNYDVFGPVYQELPFFLKRNGYQNVTSLTDGIFQAAWKTKDPLFTWLHKHPRETVNFNLFMKAQRSSTPNCFEFYPIEEECRDWPADRAVFVDVGGGAGHQCNNFRSKFPQLPGKVHDFVTPQPVEGAKYYYLRAILHDHSEESVKILKNLVPVMGPESVILLDEMALPNENIDWFATQTDITMMCGFGSMERTVEQWGNLLKRVGLRIEKLVTYTWSFRLSIIKVVKK